MEVLMQQCANIQCEAIDAMLAKHKLSISCLESKIWTKLFKHVQTLMNRKGVANIVLHVDYLLSGEFFVYKDKQQMYEI